MAGFEWAHAAAGLIGAIFGIASGIFAGGWRLGQIEGRMNLALRKAVSMSEKQIESQIEDARQSFDETLKGLRQKINDVELDAERRFLLKNDFNDFREEYREDMRDLKSLFGRHRQ